MPFQFTCPYCYKKTIVSEDLAGQDGPCVGCGKQITIPQPPTQNPIVHPIGQPPSRPPVSTQRAEVPVWWFKTACVAVAFPIVVALLFWFCWPSITRIKQQRDKAACMNNLQRIAKALNDYAAMHGTYPPAFVNDANGVAMHSWRVLILPFLGENNLFARYDLSKPWNSPENSELIPQCPSVFVSPGSPNPNDSAESNYMLLTGPGTIFPASGPLAPKDVTDGVENTLLVVEVQNSKNCWLQPIDIDYTRLKTKIGSLGPNAIGGTHSSGATAVFADGTPVWLPSDVSPTLLNSIITPSGQEPVDASWFQNQ